MKKTAIGLIGKKTICTCSTRFCTFFCRCFARLQRETSRNLLVTHYMEEILYVYLCNVFFVCFSRRSFLFWWKQAFLIFSPPQQTFMLFLQQKMFPLLFLSRSSSFPRWASLACRPISVFLRLSLSLYSKFVGMTINLSLIRQTTHRNIFLFPFSSF